MNLSMLQELEKEMRIRALGLQTLVLLLAAPLLACEHFLSVGRFNEVFSAAQADAALDKATVTLLNDDGSTVGCAVTMRRAPAGTEIPIIPRPSGVSTSNNIIDTAGEMTAMLGVRSHYVKVVHLIDHCGGLKPSTIGCADQGKAGFVVEDLKDNIDGNTATSGRGAVELEGILWAHEFGHTQGLPHSPRCGSGFNIMDCGIGTASTAVTASECTAFRKPTPLFPPTPPRLTCDICEGTPPTGSAPTDADARPEQKLPIRDFVRRLYPHGTPIAQAMQYGAEDVPILVQMLSDRGESEHWPIVAEVLGIIGGDQGAQHLIEFVERDRSGAIRGSEFNGIASALAGLGYAVERSGNKRALSYLMQASEPNFWEGKRRMRWTSRFAPDAAERSHQLARYSAMGLGLSGDPDAWRTLRTRWESLNRRQRTEREQSRMLLIEQAMEEHEKVARMGLAAYDQH